jgi:hypothetical protein
MGKFDADRFNGFVKGGLHKGIYNDFRDFMLYNERDVHAVTYGYIRNFLKKKNREGLIVRNEPMLRVRAKERTKPDLVVFKRDVPAYAIEIKVYPKRDRVNDHAVWEDLKNLHELVKRHQMTYGFLIVVYDSDMAFNFRNSSLRKEGIDKVSVVEINMRFDVKNNRQRRNYHVWRKRFENNWLGQRKQAA